MSEIIYFSVNDWFVGRDYPNTEPFLTWFDVDNYNIWGGYTPFRNDEWIIKNKICVVESIIDQSVNFCITAAKEWVEENCPTILTTDSKFQCYPDAEGEVRDRFGVPFLEYCEENFIRKEWDDIDQCWCED